MTPSSQRSGDRNQPRSILRQGDGAFFADGTFRVRARVDVFVDERTGRLRTLKTLGAILEGVWCTSLYSNKKMFCPTCHPELVALGVVGARRCSLALAFRPSSWQGMSGQQPLRGATACRT